LAECPGRIGCGVRHGTDNRPRRMNQRFSRRTSFESMGAWLRWSVVTENGRGPRLAGEVWMPVGAADLLAAVMAAAVGARDPRHPLAASWWRHAGGLPTRTARDELVRRAGR